jgi:hypothetical protein
MQITLKFRDSDARVISGFLRQRYGGRAALESATAFEKRIRAAIREVVALQAESELAQARNERVMDSLSADGATGDDHQ